MFNSKLSVVIPVYNVEGYVRDSLDSIVNQTLDDIEIVCVNDGSTDGSLAILEEYAANDRRIKVISQENKGLSAARNIGMAHATGEYLLFFDSDDILEKDAAAKLVSCAEKGNLDVLFYNADCFEDSSAARDQAKRYANYYRRSQSYADVLPGAALIADMMEHGDYLCSACFEIWRTSFLRENKLKFTEGIVHEDTEFTFSASLLAQRASHLDATLFHRRVRDSGSIMTCGVRFANSYGAFRAFLGMEAAYRKFQSNGLSDDRLMHEMSSVLFVARDRYGKMSEEERLKKNAIVDRQLRHLYQILVADPVEGTLKPQPLQASQTAVEQRKVTPPDGTVKISVIIPVYNMGAYVKECLESVVNQTLREIEVICVDDGSTDDSPSILAEYASADRRVRVITQKNLGVFAARNAALDVAKGQFVIFMDPDDWYCDLDALRTLYVEAVANKVKICGGEIVEMLNKDTPKPLPPNAKPSYLFRRGGFFEFSDYQYFGWYTRFIFDRMMLEENNIRFPPYTRYQDPPFLVRAMIAAGRFYALKRRMYACRVSHKTINWQTNGCRKLIDFMAGNVDILRQAKKHGLARLAMRQNENLVSTGMLNEVLMNCSTPAVHDGLVSLLNEMGAASNAILLEQMARLYFPENGSRDARRVADSKEVLRLRHELNEVYGSVSFRVGRVLTALPRMLRDKLFRRGMK